MIRDSSFVERHPRLISLAVLTMAILLAAAHSPNINPEHSGDEVIPELRSVAPKEENQRETQFSPLTEDMSKLLASELLISADPTGPPDLAERGAYTHASLPLETYNTGLYYVHSDKNGENQNGAILTEALDIAEFCRVSKRHRESFQHMYEDIDFMSHSDAYRVLVDFFNREKKTLSPCFVGCTIWSQARAFAALVFVRAHAANPSLSVPDFPDISGEHLGEQVGNRLFVNCK